MRAGFAVSVVGHVALLTWGLISLPPPKSLDMSDLEAVPVDFVELDEQTRLNLGVSVAEAREEPVPLPPTPEPRPAPPPPPPPEPVPEPEPTPVPEPEPEPPPEPEPTPEPEPAPAPEPEPEPTPEPEPPPPKEAAAKPPPPAPIPRARPTPPPPQRPAVAREEKTEALNTDEIAALLDKSKPTGSTQPAEQPPVEAPPTLGSRTGMNVDRMTVDELDALRARLAQCWNIQLAPPDPSDLRVKVKMFLNADGSLSQSPQILEAGSNEFARSAAESAVRAVRRCAPYNLPAEKYDSWREINITFDPREMFGG